MLQSLSRTGVHASRVVGDAPVHQLSLCFAPNGFRVQRQDPPWKVVRAFALSGSKSLVHLHNVSGGVLAGDRLALDVEVQSGTAAQITTTGATRLYRHRAGAGDSEQRTRFQLGDGAQLQYLPDTVIPYAGSRHVQRTEFRMGRGSTLFWWEVLAAGRVASGERFAFDRLGIHSEVCTESRPILREDFLLEPGEKDLSAPVRMLDYSYVASLCIIHEGRPPSFWRILEDHLNELARRQSRPEEAVWGASALVSEGVVVRGLSMSARFIYRALIEFWRTAQMAVTGQDAVPPRKTY